MNRSEIEHLLSEAVECSERWDTDRMSEIHRLLKKDKLFPALIGIDWLFIGLMRLQPEYAMPCIPYLAAAITAIHEESAKK